MNIQKYRQQIQELKDLGPQGLLFRTSYETQQRLGLDQLKDKITEYLPAQKLNGNELSYCPVFSEDISFKPSQAALKAMEQSAQRELKGELLAFSKSFWEYKPPLKWHRNPLTNQLWPHNIHYSKILRETKHYGDIKLPWEIGRFPHFYRLSRLALHAPDYKKQVVTFLINEMRSFIAENPYPNGVHWVSGQEIAFRLMAWLFAIDTVLIHEIEFQKILPKIKAYLLQSARHIQRHINYARKAVYNNHLLSEALGLMLVATVLPDYKHSKKWYLLGKKLMNEGVAKQFYKDGGYIQLSHNYQRVALQDLLWASKIEEIQTGQIPHVWKTALKNSALFLHAQQNPSDGFLPNYGANDGALPSILSSCHYSDFRPTIQASYFMSTNETLYPEGPWDEESHWFMPEQFNNKRKTERTRSSQTFKITGFHVLRSNDQDTFCTLRCGSIKDRFSQIDMLHMDLWWQGQNILVDPGSYYYNAAPFWHNHFMRTASHNTVTVDHEDQMLHYRQFKCLYWTNAKLLQFETNSHKQTVSGEHYGYQRLGDNIVHKRQIVFKEPHFWIVTDTISGQGCHTARLHWLCNDFPHTFHQKQGKIILKTPKGRFYLYLRDEAGNIPDNIAVIKGDEQKPEGWLSRFYAHKNAVLSITVEATKVLPITFVTILSAEPIKDISDFKN